MLAWIPVSLRTLTAVALPLAGAFLLLMASHEERPLWESADGGYVGRQECARCHKSNGSDHFASNHAKTWRPASALDEVSTLPQSTTEGPLRYRVEKRQGRWHFVTQLPGRPAQAVPVHSVVGGERFGLSLILLASEIEGRALPRPTLVEARYMLEAGTWRLKKSPGLFAGQPSSYDAALGRVLNRDFAEKCLNCHTGPVTPELARQGGPHPVFGDVGVTCERCHGPGQAHVEAAEAKAADLEILHPGKLSNPKLMELCSQCHNGFFSLVQPRPEDVLISNQVTALANSDCYIQSNAGLSCLDCHNPHENAAKGDPIYVRTCLRCHTQARPEAVLCPVNSSDGCIGCHMPEDVQQDNFHLTDHWIRVVRR
ncbi:MAG TPA: multiheme c-type cytochrome [Acidobacteriota bacterium]|nr:multiheme c-type cytochrome [Acidobacteriota bacterium]